MPEPIALQAPVHQGGTATAPLLQVTTCEHVLAGETAVAWRPVAGAMYCRAVCAECDKPAVLVTAR